MKITQRFVLQRHRRFCFNHRIIAVNWVDCCILQWYAIFLDGRQLKTPARTPLLLPSYELAAAVALEWDSQIDKRRGIQPANMPLMTLSSTAIDQVFIVDCLILICYTSPFIIWCHNLPNLLFLYFSVELSRFQSILKKVFKRAWSFCQLIRLFSSPQKKIVYCGKSKRNFIILFCVGCGESLMSIWNLQRRSWGASSIRSILLTESNPSFDAWWINNLLIPLRFYFLKEVSHPSFPLQNYI